MISVLRLGHRLPRDERITTHVALVSRAFGARQIFYAGQHDSSLEQSVKAICSNWGGDFAIEYVRNPVKTASDCKKSGCLIVHLTMYGIPLPEALAEIKKAENVLVIIGAEQVPREFYEIADFNIAVTSQPHSEVAALAITLDRLASGTELERGFEDRFLGGKISVEPNPKLKKTRRIQS